MNQPWDGACFGIAATMALNYNGDIDIPALSQKETIPATDYHSMERPCENDDFLYTINYYHIAQSLGNLRDKSSIAYAHAGDFFGELPINKTLEEIVSHTLNNTTPYILAYGYTYYDNRDGRFKNGEHAIVLCCSKYDSVNKKYHVYFYDENGYKSGVITISEDYSEFSFMDGNGDCIGNNSESGYNYNYIQLIDIVNFCDSPFDETIGSGGGGGSAYSSKLKTGTAKAEEKIFLTFDSNNYFEITDSEGKSLIYTADKAESSIEISNLTPVETGINSYGYSFSIPYSDTYTIKILSDDISIDMYDAKYLFSIEGNGIEQAEISFKNNEIKLDGTDYDFCTFIETDSELSNGENGLVSFSGKASGEFNVNANNGEVVVNANELLNDVEVKSYVSTEVESASLKADDSLKVFINKNGQLESSVVTTETTTAFTTSTTSTTSTITITTSTVSTTNSTTSTTETTIISGTCGENLVWYFDESAGVLTISGTGDMASWSNPDNDNKAPWYEFKDKIKRVVIKDGVTSIAGFTFNGHASLTSITIPNSVTCIKVYAFSGCSSLTSINIPDGVTSIGRFVFDGCSNLTSINVSENNNNYISEDGILFNKDKTTIIRYPIAKQDTKYIIPDSVTSIEMDVFSDCVYLTSVIIPDNVQRINDYAFYNCSGLTSITIPDNVTSIGIYAFKGCLGLTSITIPYNVTNIGSHAFSGCANLEFIKILNSECIINNDTETISDTATIYGYTESTALAYAEKHNRKFGSLETINQISLGDVNDDGIIDSNDASVVLAEYAHLSTGGAGTFSDSQKSAGDVNSDGIIDSNDASVILAFYAYLSTGGAENDMRVWLDM